MLGSTPLLVIGHVFTVVVIGSVWKLVGGIQIHWLLYSRLSLPFSFSRFSRLRLPFSHLACWLFSLALLFASILSCFLLPWLVPERNYFRKPWHFFSFPKINFIKSRKISPRQGFKKDKPFVRVTPAQT